MSRGFKNLSKLFGSPALYVKYFSIIKRISNILFNYLWLCAVLKAKLEFNPPASACVVRTKPGKQCAEPAVTIRSIPLILEYYTPLCQPKLRLGSFIDMYAAPLHLPRDASETWEILHCQDRWMQAELSLGKAVLVCDPPTTVASPRNVLYCYNIYKAGGEVSQADKRMWELGSFSVAWQKLRQGQINFRSIKTRFCGWSQLKHHGSMNERKWWWLHFLLTQELNNITLNIIQCLLSAGNNLQLIQRQRRRSWPHEGLHWLRHKRDWPGEETFNILPPSDLGDDPKLFSSVSPPLHMTTCTPSR